MNNTEKSDINTNYVREKLIHHYFEDIVNSNPNKIAVECAGEFISYGELNISANRVATILIDSGVVAGDVVAICFERSINMIVAILAVLKTGAAYLPIDYNLPKERAITFVSQSKVKFILSSYDIINLYGCLNININDIPKDLCLKTMPYTTTDSLAYVLFTSGSTGTPKGVMIRHYSLINILLWTVAKFNFSKDDVFLVKAPCSFDMSVLEIFTSFFCGGSICLLKNGKESNSEIIAETIYGSQVTVACFVPSMLEVFLEFISSRNQIHKLKTLKKIVSGGEPLKYNLVTKTNEMLSDVSLINMYGPTETTVYSTYFDCTNYFSEDEIVPIGYTVGNTNVYILDQNNNICLDGQKGEICISGMGVAKGYINNTELTHQLFITNPFDSGLLMYKTGDIGKKLEDNTILFLGRLDNQISINGVRFELEEIERKMLSISSIEQATAIVVGEYNNKIIAYYTGEFVETNELKSLLSDYLPIRVIPNEFILINTFPYNKNGKVCRKELLKLYNSKKTESKHNHKLLYIIEEVADIKIFDLDDTLSNIDSINFIKIVINIENEFNFEFDDEMLAIAMFPTVKSLVDYVDQKTLQNINSFL